jgi:hypothetical protein
MDESIAFCEKLFADDLQGHKLMTNARHLRGSAWLNFQRITCEQWSHFNGRAHVVLMGDAVHTAHFAIGSGTKLAIEDAIELTRQFKELGDTPQQIPEVLQRYQALRRVDVLRLQNAAWNAMEWFENVGERYADQLPARAVHVFDADAQPAHQPREPAPARQGLARRLRALVRRNRRAAVARACAGAAADVHALHGARHHAEEPRRRLADGAVLLRRRPAWRLPPGAPGRARDGRRRFGGGRNDLPHARRAHHPGLPGAVERSAARCVEAHRRPCACAQQRQDRIATGPRWAQGLDQRALGRNGRRPPAARGQLAADRRVRPALPGRRRHPARDDARRHGPGARRLRPQHALRRRGRLRLAGTALCARLPAQQLHLAADQPPYRRLRRLARQPPALAAGGVCRGARSLARTPAAVGAHLGTRLGRRRHHAGRCGRDRACVQGCRRRHDRLLVGPGQRAAEAHLWPHVPDALCRPRPQRGRHRDHRGGRHQRGRSCQQHHRRRPCRPVRHRPAAPGQPGLDADRSGEDRLHADALAEAIPGRQDADGDLVRAREGTAAQPAYKEPA